MPLIDMPLDQLKEYKGRNPRPDDFDAFWDRSLAEMREIKPQVELKPSDFQTSFAECFDLYFTGMGGARIHAKFARPRQIKTAHPAVLLFHGYTGNCGDWYDKMVYSAAGLSFAALDCRGQGGLSEDKGGVPGSTMNGQIIRGLEGTPEQLLFRQIFLDTAQLAKIVMEMPDVDPRRVGAMGGSQGGGLTLACSSLEPRIARCVPVFPFLTDYKRVWEMDLAKDAYAELQRHFKVFDPLHKRENEIFTKLGYIDTQFLAPRIRAHVMMAVGLMDTICPPSTQFAAYNKIASKKELVIYPDFGHEHLPGIWDKAFQFMAGL